MHRRLNAVDAVIYGLLGIIAFTCLAPILNAFAISLSDKTYAAMGDVKFWPVKFNTVAYQEILKEGYFFRAFRVSVFRVIVGVSINISLSILMAYPLSKTPNVFRGRNGFMWIMVFTMLFNGGLIPNYLLIKNMNLMDTIWALVLPGAVPVFNVIILMNFIKGLPGSLEESALIDGANPWQILIRLIVPLSKASIATITLFALVYHWNEYFLGKIYINTAEKQPLQTYIQSLSITLTTDQMANMTAEEKMQRMNVSSITFNSAKAIVSMIPVVAIYPFIQKFFVTGIVMGAVKE